MGVKVQSITSEIVKKDDDLFAVIDQAIERDPNLQGKLPENSVLAISSKIISYCQGRLVKKVTAVREEKHALVEKDADLYLDPSSHRYDLMLTIKDSILAVNAGLDESNASLDGEECYVLWPEKIQETTNQIWQYLRKKHGLKDFGVIVTDSRTFPLRWGVVGTSISACGFNALNNHVGDKDIFGREIKMVHVNVAEALGVAATFEMGEVDEITPLVLLSELNKVHFVDHVPTQEELNKLNVPIEDDVYAPLLESVKWHKGGSNGKT